VEDLLKPRSARDAKRLQAALEGAKHAVRLCCWLSCSRRCTCTLLTPLISSIHLLLKLLLLHRLAMLQNMNLTVIILCRQKT
jgi:hypothetical protein